MHNASHYSAIPSSVLGARPVRLVRVEHAPTRQVVGVILSHPSDPGCVALASGSVSPDRCESLAEALALLCDVDAQSRPPVTADTVPALAREARIALAAPQRGVKVVAPRDRVRASRAFVVATETAMARSSWSARAGDDSAYMVG